MAELQLISPIQPPAEAKYVIWRLDIHRDGPQVIIETRVQDSDNNDLKSVNFSIPDTNHPSATVVDFLTALGTSRVGEGGGVGNRINYRALGYLLDQGYLTSATLVS